MLVDHIIFIIAKEHIDLMIESWKNIEEQKRKSDLQREKTVLITWKLIMVGLKIMKRVHKVYGREKNKHLKEEMYLLLVNLGMMTRVQKVYVEDGNKH